VNHSEGSAKVLSNVEADKTPAFVEHPEDEISLLDLFIVIARNRRLIAKTTITFVFVAIVISLLLPIRYTATTSILPPQQGNSAGSSLLAQFGSSLGSVASLAGGSLGLKNPNDLQVAMLKSRTVEDAMVDRFHLKEQYHKKTQSEARKRFESFVDIDSGSKDGLIRVSVTDGDPKRAAEMTNGYIEEFRRLNATLAITEASQRRLFFEQQLAQAKDNLATAEEALKKTALKTGLIQLDSQSRATIELISQLRAQIAAKEVQIASIRSFATGENAELQTAQQELTGLRAQEAKIGFSPDGVSNGTAAKGNLQESSLEYIQKFRDVKYFETIFDLLARQYEVAKVDEARQGTTAQIVDRAVVPDWKSAPQRTLIVLAAAVFGLIVGVIWAFAREGIYRISTNPLNQSKLDTLKGQLQKTKVS
jgi:tyrosine-protein kinase Etk/Wzc